MSSTYTDFIAASGSRMCVADDYLATHAAAFSVRDPFDRRFWLCWAIGSALALHMARCVTDDFGALVRVGDV